MGECSVYLYVPNIIGYIRIILLGWSFYVILDNHRLAVILYSTSCLLDAIDGLAARLFNQTSLLGSMLDMLTDRISTMALIMTLGHLYKDYFFILQFLLALDIVSHWLHFFSANIQGKTSHKKFDGETNYLMKLYYENKLVLTLVCAMEQLFYCSLLLYNFEYDPYGNHLLWLTTISFPALIFKNFINLLQIQKACEVMVSIDQAHLYHTQ